MHWRAINITFTCGNMYDKIESISTLENAQKIVATPLGKPELAYFFENWRIWEATDIRTINSTTFEVSGYEPTRLSNQFFQQIPSFACTFIKVKYAARSMGFYGCQNYFIKDGNWTASHQRISFDSAFKAHMINNHIYPDMIADAFGGMNVIEVNTMETVKAIETSLTGSILADDEKNITLTITEYLYGKYIAHRLMDLPSIDNITSEQIDNYMTNYGVMNNLNPWDAQIHFEKEYFESNNVDKTIMELWINSD